MPVHKSADDEKAKTRVSIEGLCLNGGYGRVELLPDNRGRILFHEDSRPPVSIPLLLENISVKNHLVSLGRDKKVRVVEHLFSALYGLNFFSVEINIFGAEIPFLDGSSLPFVKALQRLKVRNNSSIIRLKQKILIGDHHSFIEHLPSKNDSLTVEMELAHPFIKPQKVALAIDEESYATEIAPARTFVFTTEDDPRLKNQPPYGIGVTSKKVYCLSPLRFQNELVRHKILDLLGDLYVLRRKLAGKIVARNTSHMLNLQFVKKIAEASFAESSFVF